MVSVLPPVRGKHFSLENASWIGTASALNNRLIRAILEKNCGSASTLVRDDDLSSRCVVYLRSARISAAAVYPESTAPLRLVLAEIV
jgi:hypothetical protein